MKIEDNIEIFGSDAIEFIDSRHLKKINTNPDTWGIEYLSEETDEHWILDYPASGLHGGGNPRLRKMTGK